MDVELREATAADYPGLCQLYGELDALHRDHLPHLFRTVNGAARERDYFLRLIADDSVALFVVA